MTTYFNWTREHRCTQCGETFRTMGGNLTLCAPCRHTPEAEAARQARRRSQRNLRERRQRSQTRRGIPEVRTGCYDASGAVSGPARGIVEHDGRTA